MNPLARRARPNAILPRRTAARGLRALAEASEVTAAAGTLEQVCLALMNSDTHLRCDSTHCLLVGAGHGRLARNRRQARSVDLHPGHVSHPTIPRRSLAELIMPPYQPPLIDITATRREIREHARCVDL
jgi:hypothetical protein